MGDGAGELRDCLANLAQVDLDIKGMSEREDRVVIAVLVARLTQRFSARRRGCSAVSHWRTERRTSGQRRERDEFVHREKSADAATAQDRSVHRLTTASGWPESVAESPLVNEEIWHEGEDDETTELGSEADERVGVGAWGFGVVMV